MSSKFIKNKEDFICDKCGFFVKGNGYTNHCPECLWSKHVDIFPGDRAEKCGGLMEPLNIDKKSKEYIIIHKCLKCGQIKKNKAVKNDNFEMILQVISNNLNI